MRIDPRGVRRRRIAPALPVGLGTLALLSAAAFGLEGKVTDTRGAPLEGARVCYLLGGAEQLCAETDADGAYELPKSQADRIRIARDGYLPQVVAAVVHGTPIQLREAAILRLRVEGIEGDVPKGSKAFLVHPTGRQTGPFPVNAAGLRLRGLTPGSYRVSVSVPGYRQAETVEIELLPREETRVTARVVRETEP